MSEEIDCNCTDNLVCPHCGHEFEHDAELYTSKIDQIDCPECGKPFRYWCETSISYYSEIIKDESEPPQDSRPLMERQGIKKTIDCWECSYKNALYLYCELPKGEECIAGRKRKRRWEVFVPGPVSPPD